MSNNSNNENFNDLLKATSKHLGTTPEELKKSAESGNLSNVLKNLDPKDAQKIQEVISDKNAADKLLSTPKARNLFKKFFGGK